MARKAAKPSLPKAPKKGPPTGKSVASRSADGGVAAAKKTAETLKRMWQLFDFKSLDVFGHYPNYTFPGFRSKVGASSSVFLFLAVFLRVSTTSSDFITSTPVISEDRRIFAKDRADSFDVPKVGLVFKQTGWKPFYDPTYFNFRFRQACLPAHTTSTAPSRSDQPPPQPA